MKDYRLNLESGPRHRKTIAHMPDLPGCIAQSATTATVIEASPDAIRVFLGFLKRHGEAVDVQSCFTVTISEHVTQGIWLANGDPPSGFKTDFYPLTSEELADDVRRLTWMQADLLERVRPLTAAARAVLPDEHQRSVDQILVHIAETNCMHVRYQVGPVAGAAEALKAVRLNPENLLETLPSLWHILDDRLANLTTDERERQVPHGQVTWTAQRALRRLLEHTWAHLLEIARRQGWSPA